MMMLSTFPNLAEGRGKNVPFYVMLFTDGWSSMGGNVTEEALKLHAAVERVYVVGIDANHGINEDELNDIASNSSFVKGLFQNKVWK